MAAAHVISTEKFIVGLQMGERGIGPKSLMERSNGCRDLSHCSAMCDVMCGMLNRSP